MQSDKFFKNKICKYCKKSAKLIRFSGDYEHYLCAGKKCSDISMRKIDPVTLNIALKKGG